MARLCQPQCRAIRTQARWSYFASSPFVLPPLEPDMNLLLARKRSGPDAAGGAAVAAPVLTTLLSVNVELRPTKSIQIEARRRP